MNRMNDGRRCNLCDERGPILDHCGVLAAFSSQLLPFLTTGLSGLQMLQTRGYDGAGVAILSKTGEPVAYKGEGFIHDVFTKSVRSRLSTVKGNVFVFQIRYGTNGGFIPENIQPFISVHNQSGEQFIVAHNGEFLIDPATPSTYLSDTALFVRELSNQDGCTWDERIISALEKKRGAWSLVIGTRDALYLARDPHGIRPLTMGQMIDPKTNALVWVAASETSALEKIGIHEFSEVRPGEIVKITEESVQSIHLKNSVRHTACVFETIYLDDGSSKALIPRNGQTINEAPVVDILRRRCGRQLAKEAPLTKKDVDIAIGIPGTGIEGGTAYAESLGLPYCQAITDKTSQNDQRTFMTAQIETIIQKVLHHFDFDTNMIRGKRIVLVDDSIVRGNVMKGLIFLLKEMGALEIHVRVLSPPIDKPCHLGINTRRKDELVAAQYKNRIEKIRNALGAASLSYISSEGLMKAITGRGSRVGFCMGCMMGHRFPTTLAPNHTKKQCMYATGKTGHSLRLALFISGSGSTMEAIIHACQKGGTLFGMVKPVVVIASRSDCGGIHKAHILGVPVYVIERKQYEKSPAGEKAYGESILKMLTEHRVDWVSQNGWLPMTPKNVILKFENKIVNQHPGPLDPDHFGEDGKPLHFGGKGMHGKAVTAAVIKFIELSGRSMPDEATIHYVTAGCDMGRVLARATLSVNKDDTSETLSARLLSLEHKLQIDFWENVYQGNITEKFRPEPLIKPEEEPLLHKAIEYAITMYPNG